MIIIKVHFSLPVERLSNMERSDYFFIIKRTQQGGERKDQKRKSFFATDRMYFLYS